MALKFKKMLGQDFYLDVLLDIAYSYTTHPFNKLPTMYQDMHGIEISPEEKLVCNLCYHFNFFTYRSTTPKCKYTQVE